MRILIVEDEPKIARAIKKGLEQEKFTADIVGDGDSALSYGRSDDYDAIVLDIMLPGSMNGIDVCQQLRGESIKTPIIMLTAKSQVPDKISGLNTGADDYLAKPFSFEELVARIRALLRRPHQTQSPVLKLGDLELNPAASTVKRNQQAIQLTSREFSLLEYLMRNQSQIVSKQRLIQHVWNDEADILPNTVEVYMGYLRSKIDKPFDKPLLHTIRGFGYRLGNP
jgi:DNA-binding response OmpR family regulator